MLNNGHDQPLLDVEDMNPMLPVTIRQRKPNSIDLDRINEIIKTAIDTWQLAERIKRISFPLYRYQQDDLIHMKFLIAKTEGRGIVGLAALEETIGTRLPDTSRMMLLHGLYVDPLYHRRGVATQLLNSAELSASNVGMTGLLVKAQADAVAFFLKKGFTQLPVEDDSQDYVYRYWKPSQ